MNTSFKAGLGFIGNGKISLWLFKKKIALGMHTVRLRSLCVNTTGFSWEGAEAFFLFHICVPGVLISQGVLRKHGRLCR